MGVREWDRYGERIRDKEARENVSLPLSLSLFLSI